MIREPAANERVRVLDSIRLFVGFALEDGVDAATVQRVVRQEVRRCRWVRFQEAAAARERVLRQERGGFFKEEAA